MPEPKLLAQPDGTLELPWKTRSATYDRFLGTHKANRARDQAGIVAEFRHHLARADRGMPGRRRCGSSLLRIQVGQQAERALEYLGRDDAGG